MVLYGTERHRSVTVAFWTVDTGRPFFYTHVYIEINDLRCSLIEDESLPSFACCALFYIYALVL